MAGITGLLHTKDLQSTPNLDIVLSSMADVLRYQVDQKCSSFLYGRAAFCVVNRIGDDGISASIFDEKTTCLYILDGFVHVDSEQKKMEYVAQQSTYSDFNYIPALFQRYGKDFVSFLSGSFNIIIYETTKAILHLVNDRFGFYPLYYWSDGDNLIFATKLEAILAARKNSKWDLDVCSMAEHLIFNYVISENSYVKNVKVLPNASILDFGRGGLKLEKYWDIGGVFKEPCLNKKDSFDAIDFGLKSATEELMSRSDSRVNLSLTGGWDSRLVLSYFYPRYKERIHLYSFGALTADDVRIPMQISRALGLNYSPYVLDDRYLREQFPTLSDKTIMLSDGTRNFKRTHYIYAIQQAATHASTLVTGIFGDEVLKVGKPNGGEVVSENVLSLLDKMHWPVGSYANEMCSGLAELYCVPAISMQEELHHRVSDFLKEYSLYGSAAERHFAFRFNLNLRKYFGNEANSYKDFALCYSPFTSKEFFENYVKTIYAGFRYDFRDQGFWIKKQTTDLYAKLIIKNSPLLGEFKSGRGYSMKDSQSLSGYIKVLLQKYIIPPRTIDTFNTKGTESLFTEHLSPQIITRIGQSSHLKNLVANASLLSLVFWTLQMQERYKFETL